MDETTKQISQQPKTKTKQTPSSSSSSPKDPLDQETPPPQSRPFIHQLHQQQQQQPFLSLPIYNPETVTATVITPKRPRYGGSTAASDPQWKNLPLRSPSQSQSQSKSPSPSSPADVHKKQTQLAVFTTDTAANPISPAASSETAGSSPLQSPSTKPETESFQQPQFRKGKYVSPVWKPNEMLWLARAWKNQYHGRTNSGSGEYLESGRPGSRVKTRAEKDREVAEFLIRHGVNRDAKTAGTKWDNMLGEFRKVYEWERCGERERYGKSYFRLSPYERKVFRLPASFDEEVFEELAQFMGPRLRATASGGRGGMAAVADVEGGRRLLPPPMPPLRETEPTLTSGRGKQQALTTIGDPQHLPYSHTITRGLTLIPSGFENPSFDPLITGPSSSSFSSSSKDLRRIGKVRMVWEESVSLWAEEGELQRGRVKVRGSSFLNAEELTFLDESMVACAMESFEEGPLKGFSVDRFISGQQVKVFGRRKSTLTASSSPGLGERTQLPSAEVPFTRPIRTWEFQDPSEHFLTSLRVPPTTLPSLFELSWHLQEPPPEDLRFPLRKDVYKDLPAGKELFFTTSSTELLDCRTITYQILSPIILGNPLSVVSSRDSLIPTWDHSVNRVVSEFCPAEMRIVRKSSSNSAEWVHDQWPNVTGFVKNLCLWRGEETDEVKEGGQTDPSLLLVQKLFWTYGHVPYILGYYAIGYNVTFCALSRSNDRVMRTDLYSFDSSSPSDRIKALVPCYRLAGLLPLLAERCNYNNNVTSSNMFLCYSDFSRVELGDHVVEMTPHTVTKLYKSKRKWAAVKEVYDFLDHRVPHTEYLYGAVEKDLSLTFKPRGIKVKPTSVDQLVEALKFVTKALVALHDLSFMHRDLSWEKVVRKQLEDDDNDRTISGAEWFVCGFEEAVSAPKIYPHAAAEEESGRHAPPEMGRGLHGVKVDVWGVGYLVKTCGISNVPKMLRELQNKCLEQNPELRPTAADCYHHLLQVQSATPPPY